MNHLLALCACPLIVASSALATRNLRWIRLIGALGALLQIGVSAWIAVPVILGEPQPAFGADFRIDGIAAWFVLVNALVFAGATTTAALLLQKPEDLHLSARSARALFGLSSLFLIAANAVVCAADLGVMWVAMEASTLVTAPIILLSGTRKSIEAAWKYLILCGVGIAFALLGTMMLMASAQHMGLGASSLSMSWLRSHATGLNGMLVRASFVFFVLGYGTKAGLFPVHNWLPDAHSEAPSPGSVLLSGALLNCGMVALWRIGGIVERTDSRWLLAGLLAPMGAVTVVAAALMLVQQRDLKRMFAYSSVENMGLLAVAVGFRSAPIFALHALAHSLAKSSAFSLSGCVAKEYGTVALNKLSGVMRQSPGLGFALLAAGAAVMGAPPFAAFTSEWLLLARAGDGRHIWILGALVVGLAVSFVAVMLHLGRVVFGERPTRSLGLRAPWPLIPAVVMLAGAGIAGIAVTPEILGSLERVLRDGGAR
ncbi:MAG: proton-conducting transporter transmembrane domain-containing protein [Fimbriimonadaceae bacterium]